MKPFCAKFFAAFLFLVIIVIEVSSCKKDVPHTNTESYFPLNLNNSWLYKDNFNHYYLYRGTQTDSLLNGKNYAFISVYDSTRHMNVGAIFVREENEALYIFHVNYMFSLCWSAPTEQKLLQENAILGETWDSYPNCSKYTVIKTDTSLTVRGTYYSNVMQIHELEYDTLHPHPTDYYYSKNIGLVLVTGSSQWELCDYHIN